jgi:hypothetical protein
MANKCRRGQIMLQDGQCWSDKKMTKELRNLVAKGGQNTCTTVSGRIENGLRIAGKGSSVMLSRSYGRCVRIGSLSKTEKKSLLNRIIKDHMITSWRAGRVGPIK